MLDTVNPTAGGAGFARASSAGEDAPASRLDAGSVARIRWRPDVNSLSALGIGCSRLGSIRNFTPVSESRRMLAMALDHGINVVDTADIYGQGDSERIVGSVIRSRRGDAFVITKIGFSFGGGRALVRHLKPLLRLAARYSPAFSGGLGKTRDAVISQDFSVKYLTAALDGSLHRLGVDTIDCLMLHSPPRDVLGDPKVRSFLEDARRQGKIRHFGASVDTLQGAVEALAMDGLELLQVNVDVAQELALHGASAAIPERGIAVFVRQVLRPPGLADSVPSPDIHSALPEALAIPYVTSAVVGLSSRVHLRAAIDALS